MRHYRHSNLTCCLNLCAATAGKGANAGRQLGAEISPSLLPNRRQEQAELAPQPCSSGTPAHVAAVRTVPNTPVAQLFSGGNSGWKENKPLGSETTACSEPEPRAAVPVSRGGKHTAGMCPARAPLHIQQRAAIVSVVLSCFWCLGP